MLLAVFLSALLAQNPLTIINQVKNHSELTNALKFVFESLPPRYRDYRLSSDGQVAWGFSAGGMIEQFALPGGNQLHDLHALRFVTTPQDHVRMAGTREQINAGDPKALALYHQLFEGGFVGVVSADRVLLSGFNSTSPNDAAYRGYWFSDVSLSTKKASANPIWGPIPGTSSLWYAAAALVGTTWRVLWVAREIQFKQLWVAEYALEPGRRKPRRLRLIPAGVPGYPFSLNARDGLVVVPGADHVTRVYGHGKPQAFPTPKGKVCDVFATLSTCVWQMQIGDRYDLVVRDVKGQVTTRPGERVVGCESNGTILMIHHAADNTFWLARLR